MKPSPSAPSPAVSGSSGSSGSGSSSTRLLVDDEPHFDYHKWQDWYGDKQRGVTINSDNFSGMTYKEAVAAVAHALGQKGLGELS